MCFEKFTVTHALIQPWKLYWLATVASRQSMQVRVDLCPHLTRVFISRHNLNRLTLGRLAC